jgi:uncharacterized lipoprotein YajG
MRKAYTSFALPLLSFLALSSCSNDDNLLIRENTIVVPSAPVVSTQGFYVANEDWFGHDNGSVNYFKMTVLLYTEHTVQPTAVKN